MTEVELRIPLGLGEAIRRTVYRHSFHEYVVFALVTHARLGAKDVLLVRDIMSLPEEAYLDSPNHGAFWGGSSMLPIVNRAMDEGLGIVLIHAHDHEGKPAFSPADAQSAERLVPFFRARVPGRPHGSVVLSRNRAGGTIVLPGADVETSKISVRWMGPSIEVWPSAEPECAAENVGGLFHRQVLAIGSMGQARLRALKVLVVGLSGGGSHVVQQLAHMGVGEIVGIDPQRLEWTNHHRAVGLTWWDFFFRRKKVNAFRRMVNRIGSGTRFIGIPESVPHPATVEHLKNADLIIGCLDNLHARSDLQAIAARYLIPYIDIGVNIRSTKSVENGKAQGAIVGGNVLTFIPGSFCLWCCDFLSTEKLAQELSGPDRSYFVGAASPEAQVVSFNGLVASQAINEILQLITGFSNRRLQMDAAEETLLRGYKKLDGTRGTLEEWGAKRNPACTCCVENLGLGDPLWTAEMKD